MKKGRHNFKSKVMKMAYEEKYEGKRRTETRIYYPSVSVGERYLWFMCKNTYMMIGILILLFALGGYGTAIADTVTITTGGSHTCTKLSNGMVQCWGGNYSGQLGDGTTTDRIAPVVVSGITTAVAIEAGYAHTCAVMADGTVKCWGDNYEAQLGDGTTTDRYTPVTVSGITTAVAISAGSYHTCAVLADGTAKCWGG